LTDTDNVVTLVDSSFINICGETVRDQLFICIELNGALESNMPDPRMVAAFSEYLVNHREKSISSRDSYNVVGKELNFFIVSYMYVNEGDRRKFSDK